MNYHDNSEGLRKKFETILEGLNYYELHLLNTMVVNRMKVISQAGTLTSMSKFNIGDRVSWYGSDEVKRTGIVIRMNQKTVSVQIGNEGLLERFTRVA